MKVGGFPTFPDPIKRLTRPVGTAVVPALIGIVLFLSRAVGPLYLSPYFGSSFVAQMVDLKDETTSAWELRRWDAPTSIRPAFAARRW